MRRKIIAKKNFSLEDQNTGLSINIDKGDIGEILGAKRAGKGYPVIIKDKTIYIKERKLLRYLFKDL